ncbi:MAG: DUF3311 domain-containing protein [Nocardioidaceae bacterium]
MSLVGGFYLEQETLVAEPARSGRSRGVWWVVGVLLAIPTVMPLLVPIYARAEPEFIGFPFYYWYQFLWIILAATLTTCAYLLTSRQEKREREARKGKPEGGPR